MSFRFIIGLGNPGPTYQETRHNLGFAILDEMARQQNLEFRSDRRGPSHIASWGTIFLIKPMTYMNCVGPALRAWLQWEKREKSEALVVVDDFQLPLGMLRLRSRGSHGGHNGLRSVQDALGSSDYARLRCGIGPVPPHQKKETFVLDKFRQSERAAYLQMIQDAVDVLLLCRENTIDEVMNQWNRRHVPSQGEAPLSSSERPFPPQPLT